MFISYNHANNTCIQKIHSLSIVNQTVVIDAWRSGLLCACVCACGRFLKNNRTWDNFTQRSLCTCSSELKHIFFMYHLTKARILNF